MKGGAWVLTALKEFLINIVISTVTFWVGVLVWTLSASLNLSFVEALYKISSNGELVIYSATLMAPIVYAVVKDPPVRFKVFFQIFGFAVVGVGIVIYVVGIFDGFSESIVNFSFVCFGLAVSVFLIVLLVQHEFNSRVSAPKIQADNMENTLIEYGKRRGVQP